MDRWGIDSPEQRSGFLSQVAGRSEGLHRTEESLLLSAKQLARRWPRLYAVNPASGVFTPNVLARSMEGNPEKIANFAFAGVGGNRNYDSGDGWLYRARGFIPLKYRDEYASYSVEAARPTVVDTPDSVLDPYTIADVSGWYWAKTGCSDVLSAQGYLASLDLLNFYLDGDLETAATVASKCVVLYRQISQTLGADPCITDS